MARFAIIIGGIVANVIEANAEFAACLGGDAWVASDSAAVGDHWSAGAGFTRPAGAPQPPAPSAPAWADPLLSPRYWWIDVGPFFDRFGAKALAVTSSADAQVQGLLTLILPRQYIDLKRPDLPGMLDLLVSKGLITAADKAAILTTPTTDYERHIKGLAQPL